MERFRKSPERNLPEQKTRRYAGGKRRWKARGRGKEGAGEGGMQEGESAEISRGLKNLRREALRGRLHPAKEKIRTRKWKTKN